MTRLEARQGGRAFFAMSTTKKRNKLRRAVAYIRMSSDDQAASPARQRAELLKLAEREGFEIVQWYEDHGLTGTESENRAQFQTMLQDAENGHFKTLLIYEESRLSREHPIVQLELMFRLDRAGVEVYSCQRGRVGIRGDDIGAMITTLVSGHGSHDESKKLSERTTSGKRESLKRKNRVFGGLFGFDRVYTDDQGVVRARVTYKEKFRSPGGWKCTLVPSSIPDGINAVKRIFREVDRGDAYHAIARRLNDEGIEGPKGGRWNVGRIKQICRNTNYVGRAYCGGSGKKRSKFSTVAGEEGRIEIPDSHDGIVGPEMFARVQKRISEGRLPGPRSKAHPALLRGLVFCACGGRVFAMTCRQKGRKTSRYYNCQKNGRCSFGGFTITARRLDCFAIDIVKSIVLNEGTIEAISSTLSLVATETERESQADNNRLAEIERMLENAAEQVCRISSEVALNRITVKMEELEREAVEIRERLWARSDELAKTLQEDVIGMLPKLKAESDEETLASLIPLLIERVEVQRQRVEDPISKQFVTAVSGVVTFSDYLGFEPMEFSDPDLPGGGIWTDVVRYVRQQGGRATTSQLKKEFGHTVFPKIRHAKLTGLLEQNERGVYRSI